MVVLKHMVSSGIFDPHNNSDQSGRYSLLIIIGEKIMEAITLVTIIRENIRKVIIFGSHPTNNLSIYTH